MKIRFFKATTTILITISATRWLFKTRENRKAVLSEIKDSHES